jgi:hypothetical protein
MMAGENGVALDLADAYNDLATLAAASAMSARGAGRGRVDGRARGVGGEEPHTLHATQPRAPA